ncbi:hypothetical protein GTE46_005139 [Salmonella enterica subsp. enterica]|uniref:hypothetical protein n=1 Tax=Salmonella enterica TaxID=28901 RepID=UPI0009E97143|nr:hypothetical protein [Salmonella enterica]EDY2188380.1 hypothetical protein [Salmonella enterica subsp. enterica]EDY2803614.1 hypothetical protein [Salmonella enterica subsp. enterica]EHR6916891.1 hypothetical protein [Salmonella enterica]EHR8817293.1 hypothetical protein [Salmonella enterica]
MDSPLLMLVFWLADRWGEADPRKLLSLPAPVLTMWQAFFNILNRQEGPHPPPPDFSPPQGDEDECAAFMRVIK